jgi:hypothetical protein
MTEPTLKLRNVGLDWRLVEGEIVAVDLTRSEYLGINGTGSVLWQALVDGATRAALVETLLDQFEVPPERAGQDVDAFLGELREQDLLQADGSPPA